MMTLVTYSQRQDIRVDIFDNLELTSADGRYKAKLEKNIFDDLIFKDNKNNSVKLEKKYLDKEYPGIRSSHKMKSELLRSLVHDNRRRSSYDATYSIDIFDKLIIKDNQGYYLEQGKDIFGNEMIEEVVRGEKSKMTRNFRGGLEYTQGTNKASLEKDVFDFWIYKDSYGNEVRYGKKAWERNLIKFKGEEAFFWFLIDMYFMPKQF